VGALRIRLLTVSELGNPLAVVASVLTVFVPALVINTRERLGKGGTFSDQFGPTSHLPLTLVVPLLVRPPTVTSRARENSVVPLAVAVMKRPGVRDTGKLMVKLLAPSGVTLVARSSVLPSPKPDGSTMRLENNSSRKLTLGVYNHLITVLLMALLTRVRVGKPAGMSSSAVTSMPR